jgi:hypothetical protein
MLTGSRSNGYNLNGESPGESALKAWRMVVKGNRQVTPPVRSRTPPPDPIPDAGELDPAWDPTSEMPDCPHVIIKERNSPTYGMYEHVYGISDS